jgi:hypothetical protein
MHEKLVELNKGMETTTRKRLHEMAGAIQIIRDRLK